MFERWLRCSVYQGMFSDECAINYHGQSVFVPRSKVADDRLVRVQAYEDRGSWWAILPSSNREVVEVQKADDLVAL